MSRCLMPLLFSRPRQTQANTSNNLLHDCFPKIAYKALWQVEDL
jgi:hypothetical protein